MTGVLKYTTDGTNYLELLAGPKGDQGIQGEQGSSGETILDGSGPPTDADGEVGDFYLDTGGQILYGPKSAEALPETLFTDEEPPLSVAASEAGGYTFGQAVKTLADVDVLALRYYRPTESDFTITATTLYLWNANTSELIASASTTGELARGWYEAPLPSPVPVAQYTTMYVTFELDEGDHRYGGYAVSDAPVLSTAYLQGMGMVFALSPPDTFPVVESVDSSVVGWADVVVGGGHWPVALIGAEEGKYLPSSGGVVTGPLVVTETWADNPPYVTAAGHRTRFVVGEGGYDEGYGSVIDDSTGPPTVMGSFRVGGVAGEGAVAYVEATGEVNLTAANPTFPGSGSIHITADDGIAIEAGNMLSLRSTNDWIYLYGNVMTDGGPLVTTGTGLPDPALSALLGWAYDPIFATGTAILPASGTMAFGTVWLPSEGATISSLKVHVTTAGSGLTGAYMALYNATTLVLLGTSANVSTAFQSVGLKSVPLVTPWLVPDARHVRVGIWVTGTTMPTLAATVAPTHALMGGTPRFGTANTGLTNTAPANMWGGTATSACYWFAAGG